MTSRSGRREVVAVLHTLGRAEAWLPTVVSLGQARPGIPVVAGGPDETALAPLVAKGAVARVADSLPALVNQVWAEHRCHLVVISDTAVLPRHALDRALELVDDDLQTATVSFLCNAAGFLSFPYRHRPVSHQITDVGGLDEEAVTTRLRVGRPTLDPVAVPFAVGPAVVLSSFAMSAVGPLCEDVRADVAVADFSLRGRRKGFVDVVDPSTFVVRALDVSPLGSPPTDPSTESWLTDRHPQGLALVSEDRDDPSVGLATVHRAARAKVLGLRVLIDGRRLWPREMGTQVQTLALIEGLSRRPDVERVGVALTDALPPYARHLAADAKIDARAVPDGDLSVLGSFDVAHRPFQPDGPDDVKALRRAADRAVMSLLDLISYQVGSYHPTTGEWVAYRRNVREAAADYDGVLLLSDDTRRRVLLERLPVPDDRLFTVELGTDHLVGGEAETVPRELLARSFAAEQFVLVIGPNYAHKNRQIAVAAVGELRRRGAHLSLVMVGSTVPFGSSRIPEAAVFDGSDDTFVLPNVTSMERNWLLRHASAVLYPTSSEGFGLVPYEAARFGTPTVLIPVGPLVDLAGSLPVVADDWSATSVADATERLLGDPAVAAAQVAATLGAGAGLTWDATVERLTEVYRTVLSRPPVPTAGGH